jgi:hypothetical protein
MKMLALTLFFFHVEPEDIDQLVKYWKYIEILESEKILPMPNIPLKFETK